MSTRPGMFIGNMEYAVEAGMLNVGEPAPDFRLTANDSTAYGVHVPDLRICQRGCFVLDKDNIIRHAEYTPVMGNEINFIAALSTVQKLI
jgi:peroxiredoxin